MHEQSKPYYECWAGTKHYATNVPEGLNEDAPLQFLCDCMGSVWQNPAVIRERERMPTMTFEDAAIVARLHEPPRHPIVRYGDLKR